MSDDKMPMQANGQGTDRDHEGDGRPETAVAGESGGGAYPNPHKGKKPQHGMLDRGGQTEIDQKLTPGEARDGDGSKPDRWPEGRRG